MKKLLSALLLTSMLLLTGCNKQIFDTTYKYKKVHIYETDTCYNISSWNDYDGEQLQLHITGKGKILISSYNCFLVEDKCLICD